MSFFGSLDNILHRSASLGDISFSSKLDVCEGKKLKIHPDVDPGREFIKTRNIFIFVGETKAKRQLTEHKKETRRHPKKGSLHYFLKSLIFMEHKGDKRAYFDKKNPLPKVADCHSSRVRGVFFFSEIPHCLIIRKHCFFHKVSAS